QSTISSNDEAWRGGRGLSHASTSPSSFGEVKTRSSSHRLHTREARREWRKTPTESEDREEDRERERHTHTHTDRTLSRDDSLGSPSGPRAPFPYSSGDTTLISKFPTFFDGLNRKLTPSLHSRSWLLTYPLAQHTHTHTHQKQNGKHPPHFLPPFIVIRDSHGAVPLRSFK
ncbi:hypothetical protein CH063_03982, partial [Colletotrichum higginsianum]